MVDLPEGDLPDGSLRQKKKADKKRRIEAAARELFATKGFDHVTTSELAAKAEVGVGTLFRYAGSKAELLVTLMNESLNQGTEQALKMADRDTDPTEAIMALLSPLADECLAHYDNVMAYQREVLYGTGEKRDETIGRITGLETVIVEILRRTLNVSPQDLPAEGDLGPAETQPKPATETDDKLQLLAHAIAATVHLDIVRAGLGSNEVADLPQTIRKNLRFLLSNWQVSAGK
ncbi:hypothetical protein BK816_08155 [Boudabousia tangfeifanii]|uniref:HTH tetR-type domain-containing protein n=1 Tax=Boudabousia tangfeifanii TaxID=1912795 RepID=A0A1D9MMN9_9ACTO|nr:hypothetical protein BK816_08155 [Boudabousia tangfeifanii]